MAFARGVRDHKSSNEFRLCKIGDDSEFKKFLVENVPTLVAHYIAIELLSLFSLSFVSLFFQFDVQTTRTEYLIWCVCVCVLLRPPESIGFSRVIFRFHVFVLVFFVSI